MWYDKKVQDAFLKIAKKEIEARLEGVGDSSWGPHFQAASNGLTEQKLSKWRGEVPEMESLSDEQINDVYRETVIEKINESLEQEEIASLSKKPPPQQPNEQADAADDRSPENERGQSPRAPESHSQQSEDGSNREQPSMTSASSRSPSKSPSAYSSGKVSIQNTDEIQSPEPVETRVPRSTGILDALRQFVTWTFSRQPAKPVSDIPSSTSAPHEGPQSSLPAQWAPIHDAVGHGQNGKQDEDSAQTAPEVPEAPSPSQPAQLEVGAQQQQLSNAQPNPANSVSVDLTTPGSTSEQVSVTAAARQFSERFERRRQIFQLGDPTVNQTKAVLSLAVELMGQVADDPLLSHCLHPSRLETFKLARIELSTVMVKVELRWWAKKLKYTGPLPP